VRRPHPLSPIPVVVAVAFSLAAGAQHPTPAGAGGLRLPTEVRCLTPFKVSLPIRGRPANPYDPRRLAVTAHVKTPSGRRMEVPCFYEEGFDPLFGVKTNDAGWRFLFCAEKPGRYEVTVRLQHGGGTARLVGRGAFVARANGGLRFLAPSRPPTGYFVERGGKAFLPVGLNYAWGDLENPARYLDRLDFLARAGVNCIRVWIAPWWLPIQKEAGRYDPAAAALLDLILERCRKNGIYVILCIEQHSHFEAGRGEHRFWDRNPYNRERGGPCVKPDEFFTSAEARRLFRQKLRYLVARYGAYPNLFAWELFNEVEHFPFSRGTVAENFIPVVGWHRDMARFLRREDPYAHMIATSSYEPLQRVLLRNGAIDFVQLHVYGEGDGVRTLADRVAAAAREYGAPVVAGEFGPTEAAHAGASLRRGTWAALAAGGAGAGFYWWHRGEPEKEGWLVFRAVRDMTKGMDWTGERFEPVAVEAGGLEAGKKRSDLHDVVVQPAAAFGAETTSSCRVTAEGTVTGAAAQPRYLLGQDQKGHRTPLTLEAEGVADGRLRVRVNAVCGRTVLRVACDGKPLGEQVLISGPNNKEARRSIWDAKWKVFVDIYDRDYTFPLPRGRHRIRIENGGRGWVRLSRVTLEGYCRAPQREIAAWAVVGRNSGIIYVTAEPADGAVPFRRATLRLRGLPDGLFRIVWSHAEAGTPIQVDSARCRDGEIVLRTPGIRGHLVGRLRRQYP